MAVFTTVGLIYLTAIVYNPVKKELEAGFMPDPVMCTSIQALTVSRHSRRDNNVSKNRNFERKIKTLSSIVSSSKILK